jgi:hypothetical protein
VARKQLRIQGLVKAMRWARERLKAGIPPGEANAFRARVQKTVAQVDAICKEHGVAPSDLPTPSYRAYRYLKELDLTQLPIDADAPQKLTRVRISGLVAVSNDLHADFAAAAQPMDRDPVTFSVEDAQVQQWLDRLYDLVERTERLCAEDGGTPGDLPVRSRRVYQWLTFLSEPAQLVEHLNTLARLLMEAQQPRCGRRIPKTRRRLEFEPSLASTSSLYRARPRAETLDVTINEGFVGAPDDVIRALVCVALLGNAQTEQRDVIRRYAATDAFAEVMEALELATVEATDQPEGRHHNLEEIFARVNAEYFDGALSRPRLTWNKTITHRKMGHYQIPTDTVLISITLDSPDVPAYVVESVMYHELLHKHLGVTVVNGRRYAHTSEFREAERRFARYEDAKTFLEQLGTDLQRM